MSVFLCDGIGDVTGWPICDLIGGAIIDSPSPHARVGGVRRMFASQAWRPGDLNPSRDSFGSLHDLHSDVWYRFPWIVNFIALRRWFVTADGGCDRNPPWPPPSDPFEPEFYIPETACTRNTCFVSRESGIPVVIENNCWLDIDRSYRTFRPLMTRSPITHISLGPDPTDQDEVMPGGGSHSLMDVECWGKKENNEPFDNQYGMWVAPDLDLSNVRYADLDADGEHILPEHERERVRIRNAVLTWLAANAANMPRKPNGDYQNMNRLNNNELPSNGDGVWYRDWNDPADGNALIDCEDLPVITDPDNPNVPYSLDVRIHGANGDNCAVDAVIVLTRVMCVASVTFMRRGQPLTGPDGVDDSIFAAVGVELACNWAVRATFATGAPCLWTPPWEPIPIQSVVSLDGSPCNPTPLLGDMETHLEFRDADGALYDFPRQLNWVGELGPLSDPNGGTLYAWPDMTLDSEFGTHDRCCSIIRAIRNIDGLRIPGVRTNFNRAPTISIGGVIPPDVLPPRIYDGYIKLDWDWALDWYCGG